MFLNAAQDAVCVSVRAHVCVCNVSCSVNSL